MFRAAEAYVHFVEGLNYRVGRGAMYLLFALMGVLLFGSVTRFAFTPQIWTDEASQFLLLAYFILGGAYAMQLGSAVRMDLLYTRWSPKSRAFVDAITIFALLFYLGVLLWGGIESLLYSIDTGERRRGLWRPYMWPIKAVMVTGIILMLLQCTVFLIRDIARLRGVEIPYRFGKEEQ